MKFTDKRPTKEGFYWCKPVFGNVGYLDCDDSLIGGEISVAQVVKLKREACGTNLHVRFIGHKIPYNLNGPGIRNVLWGERIEL